MLGRLFATQYGTEHYTFEVGILIHITEVAVSLVIVIIMDCTPKVLCLTFGVHIKGRLFFYKIIYIFVSFINFMYLWIVN